MARLDLESIARALLRQAQGARGGAPDFAVTQPMGLHQTKEELIWHESSFDLRHGLDITEQPIDTLPGELRELFKRK